MNAQDFATWQDFLDAQGPDYREKLYALSRRYGTDFLDFICGHDGDGTFTETVPSQDQREVIADLYERSEVLATIADTNDARISTTTVLTGYIAELGTTRALDWHRRCGGQVPVVEDDGSVEAALRILAGDFLAFRLLTQQTHINAVIHGHPMHKKLFDRLGDGDLLGKMFEDAVSRATEGEALVHEVHPRSAPLLPLWSDGSSGTLQFHDVLATILMNARVSKYAPNDCVGPVQDAAVADLERARRLSSGERVTVPTYVGLTGIRLGDEVDHLGAAGMRIRRTNPLDPACLGATTQVWTIAEVETEFYYLHNELQKDRRTESGLPTFEPRSKAHTEVVSAHMETQSDIIERLRFAILLSSGLEQSLATTAVFAVVANPMTGAVASIPSRLPHNSYASVLTAEVAKALDGWLPVIAAMPDQLKLSMRRVLRAAAERDDPVDRLIDAVVAWEGLFGSNPEIKFQVTGAMSILLEPEDLAKRAELFGELGKIYGMRSTFVHGSGQVGDRKFPREMVSNSALRAVSIGVSVFRIVLARPDLVAIGGSRLRSQKVLLGF